MYDAPRRAATATVPSNQPWLGLHNNWPRIRPSNERSNVLQLGGHGGPRLEGQYRSGWKMQLTTAQRPVASRPAVVNTMNLSLIHI
eukprot:14888811-Alexandrium_andersonii.AAC.1